jgi:polyvinyl alcohol dehydrogenase (cytochrome)
MKKTLQLVLTLLSPFGLCADPSCDWPSVNHDYENTRSSPCTTIKFNDIQAGSVVAQWSAPGGSVQAAPIVNNQVVYYGDSGGNLYGYDISTGTQLYHFTFPFSEEVMNGPVTVYKNVVYATTVSSAASPDGGLRLYAFDLKLKPFKRFNGGAPVNVDPPFTGANGNILAGIVAVDDLVIVATSNATSEETTTLVPTYRGGFQAFNASTGALVWQRRVSPEDSSYGTSGGSWSTGAIDQDLKLMFVGTTNATLPPASPLTDALLAIDYTTGNIKWSQQYTKDDVYSFQYACGFDYDVGASPNLFYIKKNGKKIPVVGCGSKEGIYRVFDRRNGRKIWSAPMIPKNAVPSIDGNPGAAYENNHIYTIANSDTSGISYNAFSVLAQYGVQFEDFDPIIQLENYIAGTDYTHISAINANTGKVKWTNQSVSASLDSITVANGVLYTGNFLGQLRALDSKTGAEYLISTLPSGIGAPVTVVGDQIFVGVGIAGVGGLYVFQKQ